MLLLATENQNIVSTLIETKRLILKEMKLSDVPDLFALNNDPEVIRYTGDQSFNNLEEVVSFIKAYSKYYQTYNCGRLSTFLKETGEYIGWCGLKYLVNKDATDLGYRFTKKHWEKVMQPSLLRLVYTMVLPESNLIKLSPQQC